MSPSKVSFLMPRKWRSNTRLVLVLTGHALHSLPFQFAIAMPLSYAIGSSIPVLCTLTCANDQALDLLSQPSAIGLHLSRTLAIGSTAADRIAHQGRSVFKQNSAKGYWWPSAAEKPVPGKRFIVGEVQVRKGLKPSSTFPRLSVYVGLLMSS
jgi:hypothetical protein